MCGDHWFLNVGQSEELFPHRAADPLTLKDVPSKVFFRLGCCRFRIRELVSQWSKWNREICHEERRPSRRLPIGVGALKKSRASVVACRSELKGDGDCVEIRLELCRIWVTRFV